MPASVFRSGYQLSFSRLSLEAKISFYGSDWRPALLSKLAKLAALVSAADRRQRGITSFPAVTPSFLLIVREAGNTTEHSITIRYPCMKSATICKVLVSRIVYQWCHQEEQDNMTLVEVTTVRTNTS